MISLAPQPCLHAPCPLCGGTLHVHGWRMPGMRTLADVTCSACGKPFYVDMPSGHGLCHPAFLEKDSGRVHDPYSGRWFADWLRDSYARRHTSPARALRIERLKPVRRPLILDCLDACYGHCLSKLFNAQYHLEHHAGYDLIVFVPQYARWLVPDGVAEIWTVDTPLSRGTEWNDGLHEQIEARLSGMQEVWLSTALQVPASEDFNIEHFSRVESFSFQGWSTSVQTPVVTLIWRENLQRLLGNEAFFGLKRVLAGRVAKRLGLHRGPRIDLQREAYISLANWLRRKIPSVDLAVAGLGCHGRFPHWIHDMRVQAPADVPEVDWCRRYAQSHVVVGVHGSNMILPATHAGCVVNLMPFQCWRNMTQDIFMGEADARRAMLRCRSFPITTEPHVVASVVASMIRDLGRTLLYVDKPWSQHGPALTDGTYFEAAQRQAAWERTLNEQRGGSLAKALRR